MLDRTCQELVCRFDFLLVTSGVRRRFVISARGILYARTIRTGLRTIVLKLVNFVIRQGLCVRSSCSTVIHFTSVKISCRLTKLRVVANVIKMHTFLYVSA
jgi:hypothetical protein